MKVVGRNIARRKWMNAPYRTLRTKRGASVTLYDTALAKAAYGQPQMLGDLFNDVMGAVVPGWDSRPDWMKKIQVKPDPNKLLATAAKIAPPSTVGRVVDQANAAGFNLFYQTPAGAMPITGQTAQSAYSGYGVFTQARSAVADIPVWVWVAVAGGVVLLLTMRK